MVLTSIIIVVLRLFSLSWAVQGIATAAAMVPLGVGNLANYAAPALLVLAALATWFLAKPIAQLAGKGVEQEVQVHQPSLRELYRFAFAFLGLYFALQSVAQAITWMNYYLTLLAGTDPNHPQRSSAFFGLMQHLITCVAGAACLLFASRFAEKLTRSEAAQRRPDAARRSIRAGSPVYQTCFSPGPAREHNLTRGRKKCRGPAAGLVWQQYDSEGKLIAHGRQAIAAHASIAALALPRGAFLLFY